MKNDLKNEVILHSQIIFSIRIITTFAQFLALYINEQSNDYWRWWSRSGDRL